MDHRIILCRSDLLRLRALLGAPERSAAADREHLHDLRHEMDRATIVPAEELPADVVALGSTVTVLDVESNLRTQYTLALPSQANVTEGRISVLAPLGTALIGVRVGDIVEWHMPGGFRRLRIEAVQQASGHDEPPAPRKRLAA